MSSSKTTALGILSILAALCGAAVLMLDSDPATNPDWTTLIAAIAAGVGLIKARDNDVTSEKAGAK